VATPLIRAECPRVERLHGCDLNQRLRALILIAASLDNAGSEIAEAAQLIRRLSDQFVTMSNKQDALRFCDYIFDDRRRHHGLAGPSWRCAENALYATVNCLIEISDKFCLIIK